LLLTPYCPLAAYPPSAVPPPPCVCVCACALHGQATPPPPPPPCATPALLAMPLQVVLDDRDFHADQTDLDALDFKVSTGYTHTHARTRTGSRVHMRARTLCLEPCVPKSARAAPGVPLTPGCPVLQIARAEVLCLSVPRVHDAPEFSQMLARAYPHGVQEEEDSVGSGNTPFVNQGKVKGRRPPKAEALSGSTTSVQGCAWACEQAVGAMQEGWGCHAGWPDLAWAVCTFEAQSLRKAEPK